MTTVIEKKLGQGLLAFANANGDTEFLCWPKNPGDATSAATWRIRRILYDGSNNFAGIARADGNDNYDNICDDRASLSYIT